MVATPTDYTRYRDYSQFQSDNPDTDLNGADLDTDFDRIKTSIDQANDAIGEIRRADGELANDSVGVDQLQTEVIDLMGDWTPRGDWVTATEYAVKDIVRESNKLYVVPSGKAHTSGTFATDLAAGKWMLLGPATSASAVANTPTATVLSINVQDAINELDANMQYRNAVLTGLSALLPIGANVIVYTTGTNTFSTSSLTALARTILAQATGANVCSSIGALPTTGGALTGALALPGNPASALQAAPKQYVDAVAGSAGAGLAGGRLTLESGVGVSTSDQSAKTSIYYTPFISNLVPIYNGSTWTAAVFTELTLALDGNSGHTGYHQSGKLFDLFVYDSSGTLKLATGPAWTDGTNRSAAISQVAGRYVNSASITLRFGSGTSNTATVAANLATYVGTFLASADGQTEDTLSDRTLWNMNNRVPRPMRVLEETDTWSYSTASYQQANASTANQLGFVRGLDEDGVYASVVASAVNSGATARTVYVGIGLDSVTVNSGIAGGASVTNALGENASAHYSGIPGLGYHYLAWLEAGAGADMQTWLGDNGAALAQSGMTGMVMA